MAEEWLAVLPDSDAAIAAARALRPAADQLVVHASGRPWLLGCWAPELLTLATAGTTAGAARVAVFGCGPTGSATLAQRLGRVRSVDEVGSTVAGLCGSFHLLASVGGRVRAQGTLACVRRVFRARYGDAVIAADSAHLLARLIGADWEPAWLALRLSSMTTPFPLHESTPWRGVRAVPGDRWLSLEPDGTAAERLRWRAPEPVLPLAEGAPAVRRALAGAVAACTAPGGTVSSDLSGGMDSTSLAFLAADGPARLVTYRWAEHDSGNDDADYAQRAAARLPAARHLVQAPQELAPMFGELSPDAPPADPEEPFAFVRNRQRLAHVARVMAAEGSRVHLAGHGGDELFRPGPGYLHDLVRQRPLVGLRYARAYRFLARWSGPALLRALAEHRSPARELALRTAALTDPPPGARHLDFGWTYPSHLPPWTTPAAADAARELLRAAAREPVEPLAPRRAQHAVLLALRSAGVALRQAERISAAHGARLAVPYLDDQVIDAALAVRLEERNSPYRFKPLLAAAMRGTVPDPLLERTTKGEFSADFYVGLRRHRRDLLALFDEPLLARYGLIDGAAVRAVLLRPHQNASELGRLDATLAGEMWLRALDRRLPPLSGSAGPLPAAPLRPDSTREVTGQP
ncbi:asparagine synthase-related protein [Kitasatospora kifunensis]|uniref:Asparagine synthase (Glutamine-hydrolyzing) n=1 Tax=Kitasatospora kifunensis TaxID=58351 RepID=A0A7W7R8F2_KITKI|nr:asparagine synthase-related protein [Kitasatospora kifunensis]MBB4927276.1 asparagine synthase (glutamine-hydrolyzing) [Kitasatospora kifunensis]